MTVVKNLFLILFSLLVIHSKLHAKNYSEGTFFVLSKNGSEYSLVLKNQKIPLKKSAKTGLLETLDSEKYPKSISYLAQLAFLLSDQKVDYEYLREVYFKLGEFYHDQRNPIKFAELTKNICFNKQDDFCLKELLTWIDVELNSDQQNKYKGSIYLRRANLASNWVKQREYLEKAIQYSPNDAEIKYHSQLFSIEIALQVLDYYRDEIETNGLNTAIGFSSAKDGKFSYRDAIIEAIGNTYNLGRVISSSYFGDSYLVKISDRWLKSINEIRNNQNLLEKIHGELLELSNFQESDQLIRKHLSEEHLYLSFYKSILKSGLYQVTRSKKDVILFPNISQFNINNVDEFTNPKLKQVLIEQINFLNFFMLFRGPAMIQAFGKTKVGIRLVSKLRLQPMVSRMSKLKWPLNTLMVWLALETADGCLIRYAYVFYTVGDQISEDSLNEINKTLKALN
ncbi:MAG: hypothetical protein AB7I27_00160 [Bacteriovoracaceae bacterium]